MESGEINGKKRHSKKLSVWIAEGQESDASGVSNDAPAQPKKCYLVVGTPFLRLVKK